MAWPDANLNDLLRSSLTADDTGELDIICLGVMECLTDARETGEGDRELRRITIEGTCRIDVD